MRLLICVGREWKDITLIESVLKEYPSDTTVIHGDCRGADKLSGIVAEKLGMKVIPFPADWNKFGRGAGIIRNQQMLDEGKPNEVIAFHLDINNSKGTLDMVTIAKKAGIPVRLKNGR